MVTSFDIPKSEARLHHRAHRIAGPALPFACPGCGDLVTGRRTVLLEPLS
jgi:hypothetical protein